MIIKTPLTGFGKGIELSMSNSLTDLNPKLIESLIAEHQFIVIKGFHKSLKYVEQWMSNLGELVKNEKRKDDTTLILDGTKGKEVLRGMGRMPLHTDGLLMNENIRIVGIYGVKFEGLTGGRTCISNNEEVWNRLPLPIKTALKNNGIEALPCDTGYYLKKASKWHHFPGVQEHNGQEFINGGLHYHPNEQPSYRLRIANLPEGLSYLHLNTIETLFHAPDLIYYHQWEPGDLLLMDNVKTMHGREAFTGKRSIAQFQIRA